MPSFVPYTAYLKAPNTPKPLRLIILLLIISLAAFGQQPTQDTVYTDPQDTAMYGKNAIAANDKTYIITSFGELNMPPEMMAHFRQLTPENIVSLKDELQVTENNEDGIAVILTMRLRFSNNCIVGYIQEAPLDKTTQVTVSEYSVNIPVEWMCTPANKKHRRHYVTTLSAIKKAENQYKCKDWHIKLQGIETIVPANKASKKSNRPLR